MGPLNIWWGYLHVNGSIQAKRYFSNEDVEDARTSPFVERVVTPFNAKDREAALKIIKETLDA